MRSRLFYMFHAQTQRSETARAVQDIANLPSASTLATRKGDFARSWIDATRELIPRHRDRRDVHVSRYKAC